MRFRVPRPDDGRTLEAAARIVGVGVFQLLLADLDDEPDDRNDEREDQQGESDRGDQDGEHDEGHHQDPEGDRLERIAHSAGWVFLLNWKIDGRAGASAGASALVSWFAAAAGASGMLSGEIVPCPAERSEPQTSA